MGFVMDCNRVGIGLSLSVGAACLGAACLRACLRGCFDAISPGGGRDVHKMLGLLADEAADRAAAPPGFVFMPPALDPAFSMVVPLPGPAALALAR